MRIIGDPYKNEKHIKIRDVESGEVFVFNNVDGPIYIKNNHRFTATDLRSGEFYDFEDELEENFSVKILDAKLIIGDDEDDSRRKD